MMVYQVMDLFENKLLRGVKLWTPYGLDRPIRWMHVAELSKDVDALPDALKSHDLLIILGPFLHNNPDTLLTIVELGVKTRLSAILLYPGALPNGVPSPVLAYAKVHQFPILEIQGDPPAISNLTSTIMRGIVGKSYMTPAQLSQNILLDIMHDDYYGNTSIFCAHAEASGFDLNIPLQAVLIRTIPKIVPDNQSYSAALKHYQHLLAESLPRCISGVLSHYYQKKYLATVIDDTYVLLLPENSTYPIKKIGGYLLDACLQMETKIDCSFRIAIGTLGYRLEEFSRSVHEAEQLLEIMKQQEIDNSVKHVDDMILSLIVKNNRDNSIFRRLYETTIRPLLEIDKAERYHLLDSLIVYFDCDKNISKAAERLYLHRNTMKSRLDRIEELTARHLNDAFDCLELQMALHYYKLNDQV